jgi:hypothetical protein
LKNFSFTKIDCPHHPLKGKTFQSGTTAEVELTRPAIQKNASNNHIVRVRINPAKPGVKRSGIGVTAVLTHRIALDEFRDAITQRVAEFKARPLNFSLGDIAPEARLKEYDKTVARRKLPESYLPRKIFSTSTLVRP